MSDNTDRWFDAMASQNQCLQQLFTDPDQSVARKICKRLRQVEANATASNCQVINIEGAVGLPSGRVWLGLRAPLVDGHAVMVRLHPDNDRFQFDQALLVDLAGQGIRELSYDPTRNRIWVIAGPPLDSPDAFKLWHIPLAELLLRQTTDAVFKPLPREGALDTSSEAMAVLGSRAWVLVDGNAARGNQRDQTCAINGHPNSTLSDLSV